MADLDRDSLRYRLLEKTVGRLDDDWSRAMGAAGILTVAGVTITASGRIINRLSEAFGVGGFFLAGIVVLFVTWVFLTWAVHQLQRDAPPQAVVLDEGEKDDLAERVTETLAEKPSEGSPNASEARDEYTKY